MNGTMIARRGVLNGAALALLSATVGGRESRAQAVPNSSGAEAPMLKAPAHACDCHMHIYDAERFPPSRPGSRLQTGAAVPEYRLHQQRIGTTRTVVVTPAVYVTDNRVTLDAISQLGDNARGVAVVHPTVTDAELKALAAGGIRGIRFTQFDPATAVTTLDMIAPLSKRVNDLGWHVQIHMRGDQIVAAADLWPAPWGRKPPAAAPGRPHVRNLLLLSTANGLSPRLLASAGRYVQGALLSPGFFPAAGDARAAAFVDAYRASYGRDPHATEAYAFDGLNLLRSVTGAGARTRADVLKALYDGTFEGLTGPLRFGPDHARADEPRVYLVEGDQISVAR